MKTSALTSPPPRHVLRVERLALSYQIEALYTQALELSATLWTGNLRVELSQDRQELRIEYWT